MVILLSSLTQGIKPNGEEQSFYNQLYSTKILGGGDLWWNKNWNSAQDKRFDNDDKYSQSLWNSRVQTSSPSQTHEVSLGPPSPPCMFYQSNTKTVPASYLFQPIIPFPQTRKSSSVSLPILCDFFFLDRRDRWSSSWSMSTSSGHSRWKAIPLK